MVWQSFKAALPSSYFQHHPVNYVQHVHRHTTRSLPLCLCSSLYLSVSHEHTHTHWKQWSFATRSFGWYVWRKQVFASWNHANELSRERCPLSWLAGGQVECQTQLHMWWPVVLTLQVSIWNSLLRNSVSRCSPMNAVWNWLSLMFRSIWWHF